MSTSSGSAATLNTLPKHVAIVVKGYPRLSETFIAQEILALERLGLRLLIVSLRHPTDKKRHALHEQITSPVLYLPEYLYQEPLRVLRGFFRSLRTPGFRTVLGLWLRDVRRDPTPNRGRRFGQAAVLAAELPASVDWLHVHYLHTPASVGRYAAIVRGLPFSLSAHAKDVWTIPDWEKREKLRACRWAVTCSRMNHEHLQALAPAADIELLYHGLEADRFPGPDRACGRDGSDPAAPVTIVSVARAVEKKGLDLVLDALARLPADLHWRFVHVGGGPLTQALAEQAARLGIADRVSWLGSATQAEVLAALRDGEIFCLASRIAADGDRDGLPNVIMEAMSQEMAVVATAVAAIPEVVVDRVTGRLVPAEAVAALGEALGDLIRDPDGRLAMGRAGRRRILERFAFERGIERLAARFELVAPSREAA